jgi:hypothetical protein
MYFYYQMPINKHSWTIIPKTQTLFVCDKSRNSNADEFKCKDSSRMPYCHMRRLACLSVGTNSSEQPAGCIFRIVTGSTSLRNATTYYETTGYHIPKDRIGYPSLRERNSHEYKIIYLLNAVSEAMQKWQIIASFTSAKRYILHVLYFAYGHGKFDIQNCTLANIPRYF